MAHGAAKPLAKTLTDSYQPTPHAQATPVLLSLSFAQEDHMEEDLRDFRSLSHPRSYQAGRAPLLLPILPTLRSV
jgi:hypothetical protein